MEAQMKIDPICIRYKSIFIAAILFVVLIFSGCAGGGTEVANPTASESEGSAGQALSISNLVYSSTLISDDSDAAVSEARMTTVTGSVEFMDNDGNVSFLIIDIIDSDDNQVEQITEPIEGFSEQTSGTVEFTINIDAEPGDYTFEVYIMDETDNESNVLTGTFSVTD
jgi:hypothetical protein